MYKIFIKTVVLSIILLQSIINRIYKWWILLSSVVSFIDQGNSKNFLDDNQNKVQNLEKNNF